MKTSNEMALVAKFHKFNKDMSKPVHNTEPLNEARLRNILANNKRHFQDRFAYGKMRDEILELWQFRTSNELAGENRVWRWLMRSLKAGKNQIFISIATYDDLLRGFEKLHTMWNEERQKQWELDTKKTSAKKYRVDVDEKQLKEYIKTCKHSNGKPNLTRLGKLMGKDPDTLRRRAKALGLI